MAHGTPDYKNHAIMLGNDGVRDRQVAVDEDGKIISVMTGQFDNNPRILSVDENGHIISTIQGDHEGELKVIGVDSNGHMTITAYGSASVFPPFTVVQSIDNLSDIYETNSPNYEKDDSDYLDFTGCIDFELIPSDVVNIEFLDLSHKIDVFPYLTLLAKSNNNDVNACFYIYTGTGAYRKYDIVITTIWSKIEINVAEYSEQSGTWNYSEAQYLYLSCQSGDNATHLKVNGVYGSFIKPQSMERQILRVGNSGGIITEMHGFYNNRLRHLETDEASRLLVKQDARFTNTTKQDVFNGSSVGDGAEILSITNTSAKILGGFIRLNFASSASDTRTSAIQITIDNVTYNYLSISSLSNYKLDTKDLYNIYLRSWDSTNKIGVLGISPGLQCKNSIHFNYLKRQSSDNPDIIARLWYIDEY